MLRLSTCRPTVATCLHLPTRSLRTAPLCASCCSTTYQTRAVQVITQQRFLSAALRLTKTMPRLRKFKSSTSSRKDPTASYGLNNFRVRYLAAPSVSEKYNITWAGQVRPAGYQLDSQFSHDNLVYNRHSVETLHLMAA